MSCVTALLYVRVPCGETVLTECVCGSRVRDSDSGSLIPVSLLHIFAARLRQFLLHAWIGGSCSFVSFAAFSAGRRRLLYSCELYLHIPYFLFRFSASTFASCISIFLTCYWVLMLLSWLIRLSWFYEPRRMLYNETIERAPSSRNMQCPLSIF